MAGERKNTEESDWETDRLRKQSDRAIDRKKERARKRERERERERLVNTANMYGSSRDRVGLVDQSPGQSLSEWARQSSRGFLLH